MKLKSLKLQNFRNYETLELEFDAGLTAFVGENAQGKTNLLESVAFAALGKSFRAAGFLETLTWDRPHGRIKAVVENKGKEKELEIFMEREPASKKIKKQGKPSSPKDFIGNLRVALFIPDNLQMISGSPRLRRQYFDRLLVQLGPEYLSAFGTYQHILRQRNALLKRIFMGRAGENELDSWDEKLLEEAQIIWSKRRAFADFLNENLSGIYTSISGGSEEIRFKYNPENDRFDEKLLALRGQDIGNSTSLGPHRDDFIFYLNGRDIAEFGSRGEQRTAILSLKIAEIRYIEKITGIKPVLLLDDVFSELDGDRQTHLGKLVESYQTIITSCSIENLKSLKNARVYRVESGRLTPLE